MQSAFRTRAALAVACLASIFWGGNAEAQLAPVRVHFRNDLQQSNITVLVLATQRTIPTRLNIGVGQTATLDLFSPGPYRVTVLPNDTNVVAFENTRVLDLRQLANNSIVSLQGIFRPSTTWVQRGNKIIPITRQVRVGVTMTGRRWDGVPVQVLAYPYDLRKMGYWDVAGIVLANSGLHGGFGMTAAVTAPLAPVAEAPATFYSPVSGEAVPYDTLMSPNVPLPADESGVPIAPSGTAPAVAPAPY